MYIMVDWDDVVLGPRNVCASIAVNVGYCHRFRRLMGRGLIATNHHTHTHTFCWPRALARIISVSIR